MEFNNTTKYSRELVRVLRYRLASELRDHLGNDWFTHIGVIDQLDDSLAQYMSKNDLRIKGIHQSCVSREYCLEGIPIDIACIIMGNGAHEYHLAYIGEDADDLEAVAEHINDILGDNDCNIYDWVNNLNGVSAHIAR